MASGPVHLATSVSSTGTDAIGYWLDVGREQFPVGDDTILLGRGEGCSIVITDDAVGERHARITSEEGRLYVESLAPVYVTLVNGRRVHDRTQLVPGDRLTIGVCEIEVRYRLNRAPASLREMLDEDRPTPPSGARPFDPESRSAVPPSNARSRRPKPDMAPLEEIEHLGHLADKMFTMGRLEAAIKIIASHIEHVLVAAERGKVPDHVVDRVGHYAVKLAHETLNGKWLNKAIELHLRACRPLRAETIQQVASLRSKAPLGDDELIERYCECLRSEQGRMSFAERQLCERIACLLPALPAER